MARGDMPSDETQWLTGLRQGHPELAVPHAGRRGAWSVLFSNLQSESNLLCPAHGVHSVVSAALLALMPQGVELLENVAPFHVLLRICPFRFQQRAVKNMGAATCIVLCEREYMLRMSTCTGKLNIRKDCRHVLFRACFVV